ncbi:MAG: M64 family metallopeptidase, partial [Oscillospiraceae bacterium]|nr:M64 family metallopeptidase [Oscillospiraceae bacterium]
MRKLISFLLCAIIIFTATACSYINEIIHEVNRELAASMELGLISEIGRNSETDIFEKEIEQPIKSRNTTIQENAVSQEQALNMSSPEAFIDSVWNIFGVVLQDNEELLYSEKGLDYMREIEHALWLFSPAFMRRLTDTFHKEHRATYIIRLGGHNDDQYGIAEWFNNIIITVFLDNDPAFCGITAPVLAHEIGHTIHYLIEEYIGEEQSELDMMVLNGEFEYAGDRYDRV